MLRIVSPVKTCLTTRLVFSVYNKHALRLSLSIDTCTNVGTTFSQCTRKRISNWPLYKTSYYATY